MDPVTNSVVMFVTVVHLAALGQIESGDRDGLIGKSGEITRFQVLPAVLHENGFGTADVDGVAAARIVVAEIWNKRVVRFEAIYRREPDLTEVYLLWHRPTVVYRLAHRRTTRLELERASRFANLVEDLQRDAAKTIGRKKAQTR